MVAMLVLPATTAYLLTHRLSTMMLLAAIFASLILPKHSIWHRDRLDCNSIFHDRFCMEKAASKVSC